MKTRLWPSQTSGAGLMAQAKELVMGVIVMSHRGLTIVKL